MSSHSPTRTLVAALAVLGLSIALAACGGGDVAGSDLVEGGTNASAGADPAAEPDTEPAAEPDTEPAAEPASTLTHDEVLRAGLDQTAAIRCAYRYDEQERANLALLAQGAEVPEGMTVYLSGDAIYTDIPNPDASMSHMLALDGFLYTWKVPGDSEGIKSADLTEGGDALKQRLASHTHDCVIYDGPASIFVPPTDITFQLLE